MQAVDRIIKDCKRELTFDFVRAAGPGGQNVNKVATAAQLRFDVRSSAVLSQRAKARLKHLAGKRMTGEGILVIEARRHRTQEANRADAIARFEELVRKSLEQPKKRVKTKPSPASREKRLQSKKRRSEVKKARRGPSGEE